MKFEGFDWDDWNREKCQKHGVSIGEIEQVFINDDVWFMPDFKHSRAEDRIIAVANVDGRYVFTKRGELIRPVSARYMHKDEVDYYEEENN